MLENRTNSGQLGTFAAIREYYIKAAAYDAGFHRHSDNLTAMDNWTTAIIASVTAITSVGAFGSFFIHNTATWAKVVVFVLSGTAAVLTAVTQNVHWAREKDRSRLAGDKWLEQRNRLRNLAARLCNGGEVTESELDDISTKDKCLVADNPPIPNRLYDRFKATNRELFDQDFSLRASVGG